MKVVIVNLHKQCKKAEFESCLQKTPIYKAATGFAKRAVNEFIQPQVGQNLLPCYSEVDRAKKRVGIFKL